MQQYRKHFFVTINAPNKQCLKCWNETEKRRIEWRWRFLSILNRNWLFNTSIRSSFLDWMQLIHQWNQFRFPFSSHSFYPQFLFGPSHFGCFRISGFISDWNDWNWFFILFRKSYRIMVNGGRLHATTVSQILMVKMHMIKCNKYNNNKKMSRFYTIIHFHVLEFKWESTLAQVQFAFSFSLFFFLVSLT